MNDKKRTLWFLGILLLIVLGFTLLIIAPFFQPVAAAIIVAVVFHPWHERMLRQTKGRAGRAALLSTLAVVFLAAVPMFILTILAANESVSAAQYLSRRSEEQGGFTQFLTSIADRAMQFASRWVDVSKYDLHSAVTDNVQKTSLFLIGSGATFAGNLARFLVSALFVVIILFFLFRDGRDWVHRAGQLLPLSPAQAKLLFQNISDTIVANVYGILSVAAAQGILTGIACAIAGLQSPLLLGVAAAFASIVPVVGAALVWAPAGLYLIFAGSMWKGAFILLWGVLVVSTADNVVRTWVVGGRVEMHPLVLLFFILGGVEAFGFLGLFLGPVIASVLEVLFQMFRDELGQGDPAHVPDAP